MEDTNYLAEQLQKYWSGRDIYTPGLFDVQRFINAQNFVGDDRDRLMVFLSFVVARRPTGVESLSSGGKTAMVEATLKLLPNDSVYRMELSSQKAEMYSGEEIGRSKVVFLPELQLALRNNNELTQELLKHFGEGKDLNYKRVVGIKTLKLHLPYRPFIYTLALENKVKPDEELSRRVIKLTTDISAAQTKKVMEAKAMERILPDNMQAMEPWEQLCMKDYVNGVASINGGLRFINPYGLWLQSKIPNTFVTARTMVQQYLDCIEAVTRFYLPQKTRLQIDGKAFVSLADCWLLHAIYGENFLYSSLQIPQYGHYILECFRALDKQQNVMGGFVVPYRTISDVLGALKKQGITVKRGVVQDFLNRLVSAGYLELKEDSRTPYYSLSSDAFKFETALNWREGYEAGAAIMDKYYPTEARLFRTTEEAALGSTCDPFTGSKVNVLEVQELEPIRKKIADEIVPSGAVPMALDDFGDEQ